MEELHTVEIDERSAIEHFLKVDRLLVPICDVLDTRGKALIVSPNLLPPLRPLGHILKLDRLDTRCYGFPAWAIPAITLNTAEIVRKLVARNPIFLHQ